MSMESLPQLRMIHRLEAVPPRPALPAGYRLRQVRPADTEPLACLLSRAFQERWDPKRVNEVLLQNDEVLATWVVELSGYIVATASLQFMPEFPDTGWIHYVGADTDHSGKGLGYAMAWTVLDSAAKNGNRDAMLTTDDFRLAAIKTYLKLGFKPDSWHASHQARWQAVLRQFEPVGIRA